jgi:hypothetical protein
LFSLAESEKKSLSRRPNRSIGAVFISSVVIEGQEPKGKEMKREGDDDDNVLN